jgi:hypothetical protein
VLHPYAVSCGVSRPRTPPSPDVSCTTRFPRSDLV